MAINTYGDISPRTAAKAVKRLLTRGQHEMVIERFGQKDPQPKNNSNVRKYRRYLSFERATSPLAEGVTPAGQKLAYEDVTITLQPYGAVSEITDVIQDTHEDPILNELMDLSGEQSAETIETIRIEALRGGTNVFYANGATARTSVNSPPTRGDFLKIKRFFRKNKGRTISQIISASPKIATEPIQAAYWAMGHTDLEADIRKIPGFVPAHKYADSTKALPNEIGEIEGIRIVLTDMFEPWEAGGYAGTTYLSSGAAVTSSTECDVYPLLVVARDAYAIVPLQGADAAKITVLNPGQPSKSDPLGQRGYVSWKTWQGAGILNQAWLCRLECAATANPS